MVSARKPMGGAGASHPRTARSCSRGPAGGRADALRRLRYRAWKSTTQNHYRELHPASLDMNMDFPWAITVGLRVPPPSIVPAQSHGGRSSHISPNRRLAMAHSHFHAEPRLSCGHTSDLPRSDFLLASTIRLTSLACVLVSAPASLFRSLSPRPTRVHS
jgi:hypothetical protein